jgi:sodium transport system ATP-binding protein
MNWYIHNRKGTIRDRIGVFMSMYLYDKNRSIEGGGNNMIDIQHVSKIFPDKKKNIEAVKDISFQIKNGDVVGLLGENGAGKTTLLRMISTIMQPSEGQIYMDGINIHKDPMKIKGKIGVLFGSETGLYDRLSARENLAYFAKLHGLSKHETQTRIDYLSVRFGMKEYLDRRVGAFSKGMRQKVTIARTLIHDPDIILLDEPTTGLDITSANMFRELIHQLRKEGKTIIFSSHIMEEVKQLCQSIVMIHKGHMIYNGTTEDLYKQEESNDLNYIFMSLIVRGAHS